MRGVAGSYTRCSTIFPPDVDAQRMGGVRSSIEEHCVGVVVQRVLSGRHLVQRVIMWQPQVGVYCRVIIVHGVYRWR